MSVPSIQTAFAAGEIAPSLYGHVDYAKFHVAATTLRNAFVNYRGGAYSRAGTALVIRSKQPYGAAPPRLVTFQFNINQGYCLEFGDNYMRVHSDGAPVIEAGYNISGITQADPAVVTVSASGALSATAVNGGVVQSYAVGDEVTLAGGSYSSPAILGVTNTELGALLLNDPGGGVFAPGDTIELAGGTQTTPAVLTVSTTQVAGATVAAGGSGGTDGTQTVTGTTGTGTKFQASVTVAAGAISAVLSIAVAGAYTANPTTPAAEPVTGAGLTGAKLDLAIGVLSFAVTTAGVFTVNPPGGAFTQASTSGSGTGATFQAAVMAPNQVSVVSAGVYSALPSNPVSQASTTGYGIGARFNLSTNSAIPFNDGDWIVIDNVSGMTELNGSTYIVARASEDTFILEDLSGNAVNSTNYGAYTAGGVASRIYTLATPYAAVDLPYLKFTQSADVMSLCCVNQTTGAEYPPYDLARITASDWTLTETNFVESIGPPASCSATATTNPSQSTSPPTLPAAYAYVVTAVDALTGEESIASPIANVTNSVDIAATAGSIIINWSAVSGAAYYNVYKAPTSYNTDPGNTSEALPVPAGAIFGYMLTSYGTQAVDSNITPDETQVPPLHQDPFARGQVLGIDVLPNGGGSGITALTVTINTSTGSGFIGEPVLINGELSAVIILDPGEDYADTDTVSFSGSATTLPSATLTVGPQSGTYPGCPAYYQQRRVYAASLNNPDTYDMSQPGAFLNFDSSIPVTDQDAISGTPWAQQVNGIQSMTPMPGGLVTLTGLGAWQVAGAGGSALNPVPITPSSQQAQPQAFNGCSATVPPVQILQDILYVQAKGSIWRDLAYNYWINIYTGADLTELSSHLFTGYTTLERAWCEEPYKVLWSVRNDGILLSLTYLKEQEVSGWARHDTLGQFISVASVTEPPVDALYCVAARPTAANGSGYAYYVERMDNRIWRTVEDAWAVDCGLAYPMPEPAAVLSASSSSGAVTFSASAGVFSGGNVGSVIRMGGGIATITGYTNTQTVTGTWNLSPSAALSPDDPNGNVLPQSSGSWSMTAPVTTVTGLTHLVGLTVTGLADGVPITPTVVSADGSITLPFAASNIKVGLGFTAQVQTPYLDVQGAVTIQGRRKDITAATVRVDGSAGLQVGTNQPDGGAQNPLQVAPAWSGMNAIPDQGGTYTSPGGQTVTTLYTGDGRIPVLPSWEKGAQVAVQQTNALPMNVTAIIPETLEGDAPEQTYAPQDNQRGPGQMPRPPGMWMLQRAA